MLSFKQSILTGVSFGLTSGVITTLGLLVGLASGTQSKTVILGGILVIAVADALSDALGIHISEESKPNRTNKEIWESTFATFFSKLLIAGSFGVPVLFLPVFQAIIVSIIWGFLLICLFSLALARAQGRPPLPVVLEHLLITIIVIITTYYIGKAAGKIGYNP